MQLGAGIIDVIQDTTELIDTLVERGYRHNQAIWGRVLPEFLEWLR